MTTSHRAFFVVLLLFVAILVMQQVLDVAPPPPRYREAASLVVPPPADIENSEFAKVVRTTVPATTEKDRASHVAAEGSPALRGTVLDSRDVPIVGATVMVRWPALPAFVGDHARTIATAITGPGGAYVIPSGLPDDMFAVIVEAPLHSKSRLVAHYGEIVRHVLMRQSTLSIHAAFRATGEPVAMTAVQCVRLVEPKAREVVGWYATDDHGDAQVVGLEPGAYQLIAHSLRANPKVVTGINVEEGEEAKVRIDLDVTGGKLRGVIVDKETSVPIGDADLALNPLFVGGVARSSQSGEFDMGVITLGASIDVFARAPGYAVAQVPVDMKAGHSELRIAMVRGYALHGYVRDRNGKPVSGAQVAVKGEVTRGKGRKMHIATDSKWTETSADGGYALANLVPSDMRYQVFVRSPGFAIINEDLGAVLDSDLRRDWTLDAGSTMKVRVRDREGVLQNGMRIIAFRAEEDLKSEAMLEAVSDQDGTATFQNVFAGTYKVRVLPVDRWVGTVVVSVPAAADVSLVVAKGDTVSGSVRREDGQPVRECLVAVCNSEGQVWSQRVRGASWEFDALEGPPYEVKAWEKGENANAFGGRVARAEGRDVLVVLPSVGTMEGKVLRIPGHAPVQNVRIEARPAGGIQTIAHCMTGVDGSFCLVLPDNMLYDLFIGEGGARSLAKRRSLRVKQTLLID